MELRVAMGHLAGVEGQEFHPEVVVVAALLKSKCKYVAIIVGHEIHA